MKGVTSLALTDVRCFKGTQRARLPRITVLVGDNSAGKSTFLGCLQAIAKLASLHQLSDENHFDVPPFNMGSFANTARSGVDNFCLEATFEGYCYDRVRVVYDKGLGDEPRERELELTLSAQPGAGHSIAVSRRVAASETDSERWQITGPGFTFEFERSSVSYRQFSTWLSQSVRLDNLPYGGAAALWRKRTGNESPEADRMFARFVNFFRQGHPFPKPEDALFVAANEPGGWPRAREYPYNPLSGFDAAALKEIRDLGSQLGLFNDLEVRHGQGGKYEIRADASGESHNLVDVGFGIRSMLPLLHDIVSTPNEATLLLQQPETHLHPQAQAALVRVLAARGHRILVETHSDHIPDWFRIAVMSGELEARDLGIIYFERSDDRTSTKLHDIQIDDFGNLSGAPPSFRQFFLDETDRLLGFRR